MYEIIVVVVYLFARGCNLKDKTILLWEQNHLENMITLIMWQIQNQNGTKTLDMKNCIPLTDSFCD